MIREDVITPGILGGKLASRRRRLAVGAAAALLALLGLATSAEALTFIPGDLVVYRVGNGGALSSTAAPVFLDEYSPTGSLLGSIAMPTAPVTPPAAGANGALVASGSAGSEGLLTLSPDGTTLGLTGYDAAVGTTKIASTPVASVPRTVGLVKADGTVDTSTVLTNVADANNIRSAVTDGNGNIWIGDPTNGLSYTTDGASTVTTLSSSKKNNNLRGVLIADGQLYADADPTKDSFSFAQVGTGLPTSGTPTFNTLIDGTIEPYGYALLSLGGGSAPDTLYTADESTNSILKYSLVGGVWTAEGSIGVPAGVTGLDGLTANDVNGQAQIYATANGSSSTSGSLLSFTDTSGAGSPASGIASQVATAPGGEAFRGIAFAPGTVIGSGGSGGTPVPAPEVKTSDSGLEGSMGDPTNPTLGVEVSDPNYDASQLTVTAAFTNSGGNAISAVNLTGSDGTYTLAVTPGSQVGEGVVTITASAPDNSSTSVQVPYGLSPFYGDTGDRYYADAGNASSEISVGDGYFIAGDDLTNVLHLYNSALSGPPVRSFDFTGDLPDGSTTMDIEAAAEVDNGGTEDIYWVGSESNSSSGNPRPAADTVFETQVNHSGADTTLTYLGSYTGLRDDLINWDSGNGNPLGFATDSQGDPKTDSGFNIEGFEFAPGSTTTGYLSFRSPLETVNGNQDAVIVPVTNFTSLIGAAGGSAQFGQPIELNLGGLGIRELRKNADDQYLIIAGTADDSNSRFALYTWDGNPSDQPTLTNTSLPSNQSVPSDTPVPEGADFAADAPYTGAWEGVVSVPDPLTDGSSLELVQDDGDTPWYGDADTATSKSGLPTGLQKDLGRNFEISLPTQTISFTSTAPSNPVYGESYGVSATASSGLPVALSIDPSSDAGACSLTGGTVTFTGVGQCVIDANQGGNISWAPAQQVQQSLEIGQASQTVSITSSPASQPVAVGGTYTVSASASSGLPVSLSVDSSSGSGVCSVSGPTVTFNAAGNCVIDANQAGNADYAAGSQAQQTITVAAPPVATIERPANGQTYRVGQLVAVQFSCAEGANGTGLMSCTSSGFSHNGQGLLDTTKPGTFTYTVTAVSSDGQTTTARITYTVLAWPPIASILWPFDHQTYLLNEPAPTTFTCLDGLGGSGISSCVDSNGARKAANQLLATGKLNTS
ncbi:MAG TPA: hypothetical protein VMA77_27690, partial [Solirubrobacteraceae bacterium]|nr:hypothetical protein [Solirubrobacteraceae bacterium]